MYPPPGKVLPENTLSEANRAGENSSFSFTFNPKSTGPFPPGAALGGGCFPPPYVRLDPDMLESGNLQG